MTRPVASRRRRHPAPVLLGLVLVPCLPLAAVWVWASGPADVPEPTPNAAAPTDGSALGTPLLSVRRAPGTLARELSLDELQSALDPVEALIPATSCLDVAVDGMPAAGVATADLLVPASNMKILVAAVATEVLGDDHTYATRVLATTDGAGSVAGDLYLVGGGDPLLATEFYPESGIQRFPQLPATRLEDLADAVAAAGITSITGNVVGDESRYDTERYIPSWDDSLHVGQAGPYGALLVNDARMSTETVTADPAQGAAELFAELLRERGITIGGGATTGVAPAGTPEVAAVQSAPLAEVLGEMLLNSDNNTAELVVKEIAVGAGRPGTTADGLDVIVQTLAGWGLPTTGVVLRDGSGLDNTSQLTCGLLMGVLARTGLESSLGQGLPILGETGTLTGIEEESVLAGVLRGKTGTLGSGPNLDVKALSGYVPVDGGSEIEFALVLNGGTVADQGTYRPIWRALFDALATYPAGPSPAELAPLAPVPVGAG